MKNKPIYRNGQYTVIPLAIKLVVRDKDGRVMYQTDSVEDAIEAVDHMSLLDLAA